jgi:ABC-type transport system substrate-binding protein
MAAIAAAGMLAACSSSSGKSSGSAQASGAHGTLIGSFTSEPYTADFNPYSPGNLAIDNGMIFEPLMFFNTAKAGDVHPWLATGYTWLHVPAPDASASARFRYLSAVSGVITPVTVDKSPMGCPWKRFRRLW